MRQNFALGICIVYFIIQSACKKDLDKCYVRDLPYDLTAVNESCMVYICELDIPAKIAQFIPLWKCSGPFFNNRRYSGYVVKKWRTGNLCIYESCQGFKGSGLVILVEQGEVSDVFYQEDDITIGGGFERRIEDGERALNWWYKDTLLLERNERGGISNISRFFITVTDNGKPRKILYKNDESRGLIEYDSITDKIIMFDTLQVPKKISKVVGIDEPFWLDKPYTPKLMRYCGEKYGMQDVYELYNAPSDWCSRDTFIYKNYSDVKQSILDKSKPEKNGDFLEKFDSEREIKRKHIDSLIKVKNDSIKKVYSKQTVKK